MADSDASPDDLEDDPCGFDWSPEQSQGLSFSGSLADLTSLGVPSRPAPQARKADSTRLSDKAASKKKATVGGAGANIPLGETRSGSIYEESEETTDFDLYQPEPSARVFDSLEMLSSPSPPRVSNPGAVSGSTKKPKTLRPSSPTLAKAETRGATGKAGKRPADAPIRFPKTGEAIGGFRIFSEIGRGAFARVYHAGEIALANRSVALKVSKAEGDEPRILARFQHTHIMPIFSLFDDPETGLRLLCMPYYGGANLAQLLDAAQTYKEEDGLGKSLLDALDRVGRPGIMPIRKSIGAPGRSETKDSFDQSESGFRINSASPTVTRPDHSRVQLDSVARPGESRIAGSHVRSLLGRLHLWSHATDPPFDTAHELSPAVAEVEQTQPNRKYLRGTTFVRASVWIIARLAEGLEHAHSRGLLHRDLKPSNILITADGTPMLLDFNLAAETDDGDEGEKAKLGGTLPYMAPEHLDAFNPKGHTRPEAVDERSDVYALGLILYEMVAGRYPFADPPEGAATLEVLKFMMDERNGPVPSLRAANPRVPWSLDAIVRKCMDPNPERRHQSATEFAEDLRRFLEDRPLQFTKEPSVKESVAKWAKRNPKAASGTTVALIALCLLLGVGGVAITLSGHLQLVVARLNLRVFESSFQDCQFLLNTSSGGDLTDHLKRGLVKSRELRDRFEVGTARDWTAGFWVRSLSESERLEVRRSMVELILLEARARVALTDKLGEAEREKELRWGVAWLGRAATFEPEPTHSLYAERARYLTALGQADKAKVDRAKAEKIPPKTCRDLYLTATAELSRGRPDVAEPLLQEAVGIDPRRFWSWFALGMCHLDQKRYNEAAADFSTCTLLMPTFAWSFQNRGLSLAKAGRLVEARRAYDRAIEISPNFVEARVHRGLVSLELGDAKGAEADLTRAIELGRGDPIVRAGLAEALAKSGNAAEALALLDRLIAARPDDPRPYVTRGMIRLKTDAPAAGADFRSALALDSALPLAHLGLARSLRGTDLVQALKEADAAVKGDPGLIDALELRMLLRAKLGKPETLADVERLLLTPDPRRIYNAACALSLLGAKPNDPQCLERAASTLRRAFDAGFPVAAARADGDLAAIRDRSDVQQWLKE